MRKGRRAGRRLAVAAAVAGALAAAACGAETPQRVPPPQVPDGNPREGAALIQAYGCGTCHVVPGIEEASGTVGPPLTGFADRSYIAGQLPNNAENLVRWITDPDEVEPGTAMPDVGVTDAQARHIAAYLYTLRA